MEGLIVVDEKVHRDHRGCFQEFGRTSGLGMKIAQTNLLVTRMHCGRGLHLSKTPQYKYVAVAAGEVLQVLVDLRISPDGYKAVKVLYLTQGKQVLVPPGVAHGIIGMSLESVVAYHSSTEYLDGGEDTYSLRSKIVTDKIKTYMDPASLILSDRDEAGMLI